jgi:sugar/nucleoside kinase (ribokinase family)
MSSLQGCIIGFGDPVLDVIVPSITDEFLHQQNMQPGGCIAIEEAQLDELLTRLHNNNNNTTPPLHLHRVPGGSAANVCKGIAGILTPSSPYHNNIYFVGCIGDDQDGEEYTQGLLQHGISPVFTKSTTGAPTAVCLCLITPGGQRTMRTRLGAALEYQAAQLPPQLLLLGKEEDDDDGDQRRKMKMKEEEDIITNTTNHDNNTSNSEKVALFHAEGYCLYKPEPTIAAMEAVSKSGGAVCIDLASFEVVHNCWTTLNEVLEKKIVTLVFCNEQEAEAVCEKAGIVVIDNNNKSSKSNSKNTDEDDQSSAIQHAQDYLLNKGCQVAIVSRGAKGCIAKMKDGTVASAAARDDVVVVDTVGAGDLFTAGFLCVWMQGGGLEECCRGGCEAGGEAVQTSGADVGKEGWERLRVVMSELLIGKSERR